MEKRRKNIRLPREAYEVPLQIFSVILCTQDRRPIFQNEKWAKTLLSCLNTGPIARESDRYAWCLMPDHLHVLISPREGDLVDILARWKSYTGHLLRKNALKETCWQRGFYDHALRNEEDIKVVAEYIVNNPVRRGLVEDWRQYPYSWHKWM